MVLGDRWPTKDNTIDTALTFVLGFVRVVNIVAGLTGPGLKMVLSMVTVAFGLLLVVLNNTRT